MKTLLTIGLTLVAFNANANWSYMQDTDRMTSKVVTAAWMTSTNSLRLGFPYKGDNYGKITVRQHPAHGLNVLIKIDKGQILCSSYNGCPIEIRFDDKPPMSFSGTGPADNSSDVVFLNNAQRFINEAKKAKSILISMNIYQAGAPLLEFNSIAPLEWGKNAALPIKKAPASARAN